MREIKVGMIGFGTVGSGVAKILQKNSKLIENRMGAKIVLKRIADVDLETNRGVRLKHGVLTRKAEEVIKDSGIDIVMELIGGIEPAKTFILQAIRNRKHVVTANKALLALHGDEIFRAAQRFGVDVNFEASVGGGIPLIRSIKEGLVANRIQSIFGILNGTSNYILTKMTDEGRGFKEVLKEAQEKGYAEADPTYDVEGIDAAHKLAILIRLAFGTPIRFKDIFIGGISEITPLDIQFGKEFGYRIKLLAIAKIDSGKIEARVHPTMIPEDHLLSTVGGVFNAIYIKGDAVGPTLFYGQGAGQMPTGSAVVGDLVELGRNLLVHAAGRRVPLLSYQESAIGKIALKEMDDVVMPFYMRFSALDRPRVLSRISGILGRNGISISAVIQKGRQVNGAVPVVMMTHEAREKSVHQALREIDRLGVILGKTVFIRVENELE
ncbi:MAG: homoserine dehydrogenase [Deltaproteobacteria bacterium RBG_16_49_23]|nr:MAG: homoserine dehydrogenase [Deltaproteobacteria bacterium RBG_16_49_23]